MFLEIQRGVRKKFVETVREVFGVKIDEPAVSFPPSVEMGELSIAACFDLARQLRQPPRKIAEQLAPRLIPLEGVDRVSVAGAGYLNFHLNRANLAAALVLARRGFGPSPGAGLESSEAKTEPAGRRGVAHPTEAQAKILVEHTSINPNKAAHIGHLRNAILGDTFVRLLRFQGNNVEVQNYIDNTGVQVADVAVGFVHLERKSLEEVQRLIEDPAVRFDYYCWDLYARVFQLYEENKDALAWRSEALKQIEDGHGEMAAMAALISTAIVRKHLETMHRLNVRYDLLVEESEILRLEFWKYAFELMKEKGALRFEESGKNAGCWVMSLDDPGPAEPDQDAAGEDVKIIVRSNGTVTYVGKDIAYHLWKFALLGMDFGYAQFYQYADGSTVWRTAIEGASIHQRGTDQTSKSSLTPSFGHASAAYAVIDTRQSYLQNVVAAAFRALGFNGQAEHLHHFAYEVVGLTPACAEEMGVELTDEDRQRSYVEVSGRKGLGVKADDLIDRLIGEALKEVRARSLTQDSNEQQRYARMIAVGALRYFMLKFSRRVIISFDFKEALAFEGETGPYLQYSVVRAWNIIRKFQESHPDFSVKRLEEWPAADRLAPFLAEPGGRDFWELTLLTAQMENAIEQAIAAEEPATLAKYAFRLAQAFNNFYHHHHILNEPDAARQYFLLALVQLTSATLARAIDLMGIEIPERM